MEPRYLFYVLCTFSGFLGLYTSEHHPLDTCQRTHAITDFSPKVLTFISVSALAIGFDSSMAFYLVTIANAMSAVGRLLGGLYATKFGPINAMIAFTSVAAACTYAWPFVTTHGGFIALACVYGYVVCLHSCMSNTLRQPWNFSLVHPPELSLAYFL